MEEKTNNNTKSKKRVIYYVIMGICALLLIAGIILTVYFVTEGGKPVVEKPPIDNPDDPNNPENPGGPEDPNDPNDPNDPAGPTDPEDPEGPNEPSGGEGVKFVKPLDYESYAVVYATIYENKTLGWWYRHKAIDFDAEVGTEVFAMAAGTVETISYSPETGNLIVINHGNDLKTIYRFVEPVDSLKEGQTVTMGQKIGEVAEAYGSEAFHGPHLHLEVMLKGEYVDPADYLEPVLEEK